MSSETNWIQVTVPKDTFCPLSNLDKLDRNNLNEIVPPEETWEKLVSRTLQELGIEDAVHIASESQNSMYIYFAVQRDDWEYIFDVLWSKGIGAVNGTAVGYMPFTMYYGAVNKATGENAILEEDENDDVFNLEPAIVIENAPEKLVSVTSELKSPTLKNSANKLLSPFKKAQSDFLKSVTSRLTVDQVVSGVKNSSKITFDFVMYTFFAGCIASCGLLNSSAIDIAAAMCIEPVMSTILSLSLGAVLHNISLVKMGIRNNLIVVIECIIVGFIYGTIVFWWADEWHPPDDVWPTGEMVSRGTWRGVVMGALQASAAGGAVALSLLSNNWTALVGVAIASTFLPHASNCGLLWSYVVHLCWQASGQPDITVNITMPEGHVMLVTTKKAFMPLPQYKPTYSFDMREECLHLSFISLVNTYVNALCLFIWCTIIFKIKEVAPLGSFEPNSKFFREDMRVYRDHAYTQANRTVRDKDEPSAGGNISSNSTVNKLKDIFEVAADAVKSSSDRSGSGLINTREPRLNMAKRRRGWTILNNSNVEDLPMQILREWAQLAGIDEEEFMSSDPESRQRQLDTLADLAKEVEGDPSYISVMKAAKGIPEKNLTRRLTQPTIKLEGLNMPSTSRQVEGIDNLAYQDDYQPEHATSTRIRMSSSTISDLGCNRQRSNTIASRTRGGHVQPLQLSPSSLVSHNPSGGFSSAVDNEQTNPSPTTPVRKRPLPPWLRRSLAQSNHSPYSLWPSLTQREINPLAHPHNVRIRSCNTSNISPRLSAVSNNTWQRRSTSSMPSRFT